MSDIACMPIMVVSINTLYLQDKLLQKKGLTNVIDSFVAENAKQDSQTGEYRISPLADFDGYLRNNPYNKRSEMMRWHKNLLSGLKDDQKRLPWEFTTQKRTIATQKENGGLISTTQKDESTTQKRLYE